MAHPDGSAAPDETRRVAVGVQLSPVNEIGEWLADAAALEAAGAQALWIDLAEDSDLDPVVLTAALTVVTVRSLLILTGPGSAPRSLATLRRLGRGRLRVVGTEGFASVPDDPGTYEEARRDGSPCRWITVASPSSRAEWRQTLLDAADRGGQAVLVPADPRLLDILRNPDDEGERRDLYLSVG